MPSEVEFEFVEIAERLSGGCHGIDILLQEIQVVVQTVRAFQIVLVFQVVSQRPRFGVEDRTLVLLVIVGRVRIDAEHGGERQQRVVVDGVLDSRIASAQPDMVFEKFGVLIVLSDALRQPERHPVMEAAEDEVRVLMIDRRVWVRTRRVEQNQNVVSLGSGEKVSDDAYLSFGQIRRWLERLHGALVLHGEHEDGRGGVEIGLGKDSLKQ